MYRELFLKIDRKDADKGTITDPEYLKSFYAHFLFLQGIRGKHSFKDFFPSSIYFFKTQKPPRIEEQWDFIDNHNKLFIAIRMGEIGVIAILQDIETTYLFERLVPQRFEIDLHPLQFKEVVAKILCAALLLNRVPKFISFNNDTDNCATTLVMPLQGLSNVPLFDTWDINTYAKILSLVTNIPLEYCQPIKNKVATWLEDQNGNPLFIDINY